VLKQVQLTRDDDLAAVDGFGVRGVVDAEFDAGKMAGEDGADIGFDSGDVGGVVIGKADADGTAERPVRAVEDVDHVLDEIADCELLPPF